VNGAFGVDFTTMMDGSKLEEAKEQLNLVAKRITQYGVLFIHMFKPTDTLRVICKVL
jgi:hypothetical protein